MPFTILVINPGSTSTKLALYSDEKQLFLKNILHTAEELKQFDNLLDQFELRRDYVLSAMKENKIEIGQLDAVVARGGILPPVKSGAYRVNQKMLDVLRLGRTHESNLGAYIASSITENTDIPAYIYDAVASDEFSDIARITGIPGVKRRSLSHVLNAKAVARKAAEELGRKYSESNFIVTHMGGGITTMLHEKGAITDIVGDDEGTFSPERSGRVPLEAIIDLSLSEKYNRNDLISILKKKSGLIGHLATNDCRIVEARINDGDENAKLIYEAMIYQLAKDIGSLAPAVFGRLDAVILTGGIAHSKYITEGIRLRVEYLAPFIVIAGENEMESLALGALRILRGEEECHEYI